MKLWTSPIAAFSRWRDRKLSNPDFQRRALRLPLVGRVARRRMRALFDLCGGFVYSQVLLACTRLDLFELLYRSPRTGAELAGELGLPRASVERLLEAAESLRLVERREQRRFGLGPLGAALRGNPAIAMMIEHHSAFYADLADPVGLLGATRQTTELGRFWAYSGRADPATLGEDDTSAYTELMAASQALIADLVLSSYPVGRHRRLLDVGGGNGTFALAALDRHARLEACVFDLPPVAERARARFERLGLDARASASGGDFLDDALPKGFDLISLVRVLHDHNDDAVLRLLRSVHAAVAPGGAVLVAEPMLRTRGAEPVGAAYFGFYLLAMGQGRPRTVDTLASLMRRAGFTDVKERPTSAPLLVRVLVARRS